MILEVIGGVGLLGLNVYATFLAKRSLTVALAIQTNDLKHLSDEVMGLRTEFKDHLAFHMEAKS